MPVEIAAFIGENGKTTTLNEHGKIMVFLRNRGKWIVSREQLFNFNTIEGMWDLRNKVEEMIDFLKECRVFVARSITGMPYYLLEKAKFSIWECEGIPQDFLDYILEKEGRYSKKTTKKKELTMMPFTELTSGHFFISLKNIQRKHSGLTSKQLLQPFLRTNDFTFLEIICSHTPLWLEGEIMAGGMQMTVHELGKNEYKVIITKKTLAGCLESKV